MSNNQLFFSFPGSHLGKKVQSYITNFHQDSIIIYDTKNLTKLENFEIHQQGDRYYIILEDSVTVNNQYVTYAAPGIKSPDRIILDKPSNLHDVNQQSDFVIITHHQFWEQTNELAQFRHQTDGLTSVVVDIDDILDEFNFGINKRKGAYLPMDMAFPQRYILDPNLSTEEKQKCANACKYDAIEPEMEDKKTARSYFRLQGGGCG